MITASSSTRPAQHRTEWFILVCLLITLLGATSSAALPEHPRILFTKSDQVRVLEHIKTDPLAKELYQELLLRADHAITLPPCKYDIPDGKRLLSQSRHALSNILHCSMAWRLSRDPKYRDRSIREMDAACGLKDWNPKHFLDTAEMSTAVAIGYDWLYHDLSPTQRKVYADALRQKGLEPSRKRLTGKLSWWATPRNNWGQVCATGLLIAERALEQEGDAIHPARANACKSLSACRKFYQPSGGYPEGPAYWHYGSNYHVLGLASLQNDHPSLQITTPPEFKSSALFTEHLTGPSGFVFNFSDAGSSRSRISAAQSWMAKAFMDPSTCASIRSRLSADILSNRPHSTKGVERFFPLHLLWLPEVPKKENKPLPLDTHWPSSQPVVTFRSAWGDPDALFIAMKGGYPAASHGQMDIGSFILESDGVRWVEDLGNDNYNMPGYFGSKRWSYFRLTNLSHSTLTIGGKLQNPDAEPSQLTAFSSTPKFGTASFDLSPAYDGQAAKVVRTCTLDRDKNSITITDKIDQAKEPVRWAIVTRADIEIQGKTVLLKKSGKQLRITRNDLHEGKWEVHDARPVLSIENQNKGVRILSFTAETSKELSVTFQKT